jgi:hypothetical protein
LPDKLFVPDIVISFSRKSEYGRAGHDRIHFLVRGKATLIGTGEIQLSVAESFLPRVLWGIGYETRNMIAGKGSNLRE